MQPYVLLTLAAVAALLVAEWRGLRPGIWIAKPLASTAFLGAALAAGALHTGYGQWILLGLALSWLGDVLLIPKAPAAFTAGLAAFLLGHLAYAVAFLGRDPSLAAMLGAALALAFPIVKVLAWLAPHVPAGMRLPVRAYVAAITAMLVTAAGAAFSTGNPVILAGALAFYVSDLAVARQQFVERTIRNKLWGLPLYYGAQLLLAATVGG